VSGLFGQLSNSVKSLNAASRSIETAGRNLANVDNSSYARQRVIYGDHGSVKTDLGVQSLGVEAVGIEQIRDSLLDAQVVREASLLNSYEAEQSAYERAQANLGQSVDRTGSTDSTGSSGSTNGIAQALSDFFNAFESFAASPTDTGERQSLIESAGILTSSLNEADARLEQSQTDLTTNIKSDIDDVNQTLASIADLNDQIGRLEVGDPGSAVDLRDQRQALVEELATKMSIETQADSDAPGQIQVYARDASGKKVSLVERTNVVGSVALNGSSITAGSPITALALTGGSINGALTARDGAITTLRDDLNNLAEQLVTSVNSAYNPSSTGDFFDASNLTAGTISLDSTLTANSLKASDTTEPATPRLPRRWRRSPTPPSPPPRAP
jgi:flagellar hook-associated protein 1 FlgK